MKLPFLVSVPHAGLRVPREVEPYSIVSRKDIVADGDEGAGEIYAIESHVAAFVTTDIARAILDMNRAEDDRRPDGVVKTHTCWSVPVYREPLPEAVVEALFASYYRPYHGRLSELAAEGGLRLGFDCHTMAATGPPVGPDPGVERPWVCLSNGEGTCPREWIETLAEGFRSRLDGPVRINDPFTGGYITRRHSSEMPWLQIELSRRPFLTGAGKRTLVLESLEDLVAPMAL